MVDATLALQALPFGTGADWLAVGMWLHVQLRPLPGVVLLASLIPVTHEELGRLLREVSGVRRRTIAANRFHRKGNRSSRCPPPGVPRGTRAARGSPRGRGRVPRRNIPRGAAVEVTGLRLDEDGVVAVRGQDAIAAALCDGPAYDAIRGELVDFVRAFEPRHRKALETWEAATRHAEEASEDLSRILRGPADSSKPA